MAAYAAAWAGDSPLAADAVTASPYLGFGSLRPLLETAAAHDRGVFVLAATSNPEGATVQHADFGGRTVAQSIVDQAAAVNRTARGPESPARSASSSARPSLDVPDVERAGRTGAGARSRVRRAGDPTRLAAMRRPLPGQLLPAVSREVLRPGPESRGCGRRRRRCATRSPTSLRWLRTYFRTSVRTSWGLLHGVVHGLASARVCQLWRATQR